MKLLTVFFTLILCCSGSAIAGEADVIAVKLKQVDKQRYRFDVTVQHNDQGWDHYADRWEVLAPDSSVLATRVLAHPHTNEQPFTRSLLRVKIPANIHQVTIRAHDSVHAFGGKTIHVSLD